MLGFLKVVSQPGPKRAQLPLTGASRVSLTSVAVTVAILTVAIANAYLS
jgi:hypothetical protein